MNKTQIDRYSRRLLKDNDPTPANYKFPAVELDPITNEAARQIQNRYLAIDPVPQSPRSLAALVAGQTEYTLPNDIRSPGVLSLETRDSSTGEFVERTFMRWEDLVKMIGEQESGSDRGETLYWSPRGSTPGSTVTIWPPSPGDVVDGMRMRYVAVISLSDPDDVPMIPLGLHVCISLRTARLLGVAFDETGKPIEDAIDLFFKEFSSSFKPNANEVFTIGQTGAGDKSAWPGGTGGRIAIDR